MTSSLEELLEFREAVELPFIERNTVRIEVHGGLCTIVFVPLMSCGKAKEGISFTLETDKPAMYQVQGKWLAGMGAFTRDDATKLRDMINRYLEHTTK